MLIYSLHRSCTVCNGCFLGEASWLQHLLQPAHQVPAREGLLHNWGEGERAATLVVFGIVGVGEDDKLIKFLSRDPGTAVVADFIWWPERPTVGFVQFESEEKLNQVVAALPLEFGHFRIEPNQVCHAVKGGAIPEREWSVYLPEPVRRDEDPQEGQNVSQRSRPPPEATTTTAQVSRVVSELGNVHLSETRNAIVDEPALTIPCPPVSANSFFENVSRRLRLCRALDVAPVTATTASVPEAELGHDLTEARDMIASSTAAPVPAVPSTSRGHLEPHGIKKKRSGRSLGLYDHLCSIRDMIEIPDELYNVALDIMDRIKKLETPEGLKAVLCRQWHLKLLHSPNPTEQNSVLTIFLYVSPDDIDIPIPTINLKQLQEIGKHIFESSEERTAVVESDILSYQVLHGRPDKATGTEEWALIHYNINVQMAISEFPFLLNISTNPASLVEAQVWRLLKYLCTFDPRCHPLLTVLYYWAKRNGVKVGATSESAHDLPDPSGLNWLLIVFLKQEGLIPSAKWILEQPHKPLMFNDWAEIGFKEDPLLATFWRADRSNRNEDGEDKEQLAEEVFNLLYKFFLFCATTLGDGRRWILNTRDGEFHPVNELMTTGSLRNSTLTSQEQSDLKKDILKRWNSADKVVMIHPLMLSWRISTVKTEQAFKVMRETGNRLKGYLEGFGGGKVEKLELEGFLELLEVGSMNKY